MVSPGSRTHDRDGALRWCALFVGIFLLWGCGSGYDHTYRWEVASTHRWTELPSPRGGGAGFQQLDSTATGVKFTNSVREDDVAQNQHLLNGSGVAIGDVNGDGWPDLYVAQLAGPNALYLNRSGTTGDIRFERVPDAGGASLSDEYSTGAALVDVTGDGQLDLLVTTLGGPNLLYENDGNGSFRRTANAGLHSGRGSTTLALADLNGDRALDLYVANYKRRAMRDSLPPEELGFDSIVEQMGPQEYRVAERFRDEYEVRTHGNTVFHFEKGEPDRVYFNDGTGGFEEQDWSEVFRAPTGERPSDVPEAWGLVARLEDLNGDGVPDLYVCNDFESPDLFYAGVQGDGRFREVSEEAVRTTSHSTMSIATTDLGHDGDVDFFLADMLGVEYERRQKQVGTRAPIPRQVGATRRRTQEMQNTLQLDRGDGTYVEMSHLAGVEASGWTWSSRFLDVDLDGSDDLLLSTGHAFDIQNADAQTRANVLKERARTYGEYRRIIFRYPRLDLENVAFRNEGDGTFAAVEDGWGLGISPDVGHGMATGDLDRDGDLDVVINRLNRPLGIYRNEATGSRVAVRLAGRAPNTGGIGAKIQVTPISGELPAQEETVIAGGEYVSDSGGTHVFAAGAADSLRIAVRWAAGGQTEIGGRPGRLYEVRQPGAEPDWEEETPTDSLRARR